MVFQKELLRSLRSRGGKIAIERGERQVSYSGLLEAADKVTGFLLDAGLEKGTIVGALLEDRIDIIIAMIGIMNAGGVFVPLDGSLPASRLQAMLKNLDLGYLVTGEHGTPYSIDSRDLASYRLVDILRYTNTLGTDGIQYPRFDGEDSLYIYFTSGSTGIPKGIVGRNASLLQFLQWEIATFGMNENSRVSQLISPYFDAFLRDVFAPLLAGGTICIPADELIIPWLDEARITMIHCVPSLFRIINQGGLSPDQFRTLRFVLLSGEKIVPAELAGWFATFRSRIQLVNLYGATESTMIRSYYLISPKDAGLSRIPVGSPIPDTELLVADSHLHSCPALAPGELYIISPYLTKGYLNDPALTREKFIAISGGSQEKRMAFKTGDRARRLPSGNVELLGREDRQVKLHGIRIELDEIEAILMRRPEVRQAAAILREEGEGDLAVFYTPKEGLPEEPGIRAAIQRHLESHLPRFMQPVALTELAELPLLSNGKINYKALKSEAPAAGQMTGPEDELEERLLSVWKEILGDKPISTEDSFNKAGGSSLSMMNLIGKVHKEFNVKFTLRQLFDNLTIKKQAAFIRKAPREGMAGISKAEAAPHYTLSSAQKRLYYLYSYDPLSLAYNMPQAVKLEGALDGDRFIKAVNSLIGRHESLRTSFEIFEEEPVQIIHPAISLEPEYFTGAGEDCDRIIGAFIRPFRLDEAPLMRIGLIGISPVEHILLFDIHHIVSDGISHSILIEDFMALYNEEKLPALPIQYKDYAVWQHSDAQQAIVAGQGEVWKGVFKSIPPALGLPKDWPDPALKTAPSRPVHISIGPETTAGLRMLADREGATMFMVVLAVYNTMLVRLSGKNDIVVGIPLAGRQHADLEKVIGMFVNTLPFRNKVDMGRSFTDLLAAVRESTVLFLANQDYPYEVLIERLPVERKAGRNPLFDVMLAYQNFQMKELEIPGLALRPFAWSQSESKFDLTLYAFEREGRIELKFEYDPVFFREETVRVFSNYFIRIADAVARDPEGTLVSIGPLSDDGRVYDRWYSDGLSGHVGNHERQPESASGNGGYPPFSPLDDMPETAYSREIDEKLLRIWSEVLKRDKGAIGIRDDFFRIGGHSLAALALVNKIYKKLKVKITLKELYDYPSVYAQRMYVLRAGKIDYIPIPAAAEKAYYPLSGAQKAMHFLYELDRSSLFYNQPRVIEIKGALDKGRLEEALHAVIVRHEILRTSIDIVGDEPVQVVHDRFPFELEYAEADEAELRDVIVQLIRPFDLRQAPLLRAGLVRIGPVFHYLVIDTHHIAVDGTSDGILLSEIASLYSGGQLPALRLQYKDFAQWQQTKERMDQAAAQKAFWTARFPDEVPATDLPKDFSASFPGNGRGGITDIDLKDIAGLKAIAESEGASMFMVMLSVYNILLSKLTDREDILVGTLVSGREQEEVEQMVGMFVGALPLRNYPLGSMTFRTFLRQVKQNSLACFDNQAYWCSFQDSHRAGYAGAGQKAPYNAFFVYQNFGQGDRIEIDGLQLSAHFIGGIGESRYDMNLVAREEGGKLSLLLACNKLFRDTTRERFAGYLARIIEDVVWNPDRAIADISIATDPEKNRILKEFNHTQKDIDRKKTFRDLFREQVEKSPSSMAVMHNGLSLTYRELYDKAIRLSIFLGERGGKKRIAICMPRGIDMLTAILATFQAGCVYIPIEPEFPTERIREILEDSEPDIVLVSGEEISGRGIRLPASSVLIDVRQLGSTANPDALLDAQGFPPSCSSCPSCSTDDLAYIIYTSGSTGKPKGAMIHQLGMINHLFAKIEDLSLTEADTIAQTASACFDISVWQFLSGLLVGGKTRIIDKERVLDPSVLLEELQDVTIFESVPSLVTSFLDSPDGKTGTDLSGLRWMILTGEPLKISLVRQWYTLFPGIPLLNAYGPTEASDDITHCPVSGMQDDQPLIPVGQPIRNTHIFIVDKHLRLCPVGVKGEICVAGLGVGKGYWKNEEATGRAFIPNPFRDGPDGYPMLYRTGDIGYFLENGDIICVGRIDEQLKIRGNRIEPREIEMALMEQEGVKDAVVVAWSDEGQELKLAAFVVSSGGVHSVTATPGLVSSALRKSLKARLPDYMIPSAIVSIDELPLTINGKLDKKALIKDLSLLNQEEEHYAPPRTPTEKRLARIWEEVLGADSIGLNDIFFDLGGHSLLLIKTNQRTRTRFGVELPLSIYFDHTLEEIAKEIDAHPENMEQSMTAPEILDINQ